MPPSRIIFFIMNSCLVSLELNFLIAITLAAIPENIQKTDKIENAFQECNTTNPVQRNPRTLIINGIVSGDKILLTDEEKCHLYCFLQKVRFFDENGNLRGSGIINFARRRYPIIADHNDVIIAQIFNLIRWLKGVPEEDKCQRAMIAFFRFNDYLFLWATTEGVKKITGSKDAILKGMEENRTIPVEIQHQITQYWLSSNNTAHTNTAVNLTALHDESSNQSKTFDIYTQSSRASEVRFSTLLTVIISIKLVYISNWGFKTKVIFF